MAQRHFLFAVMDLLKFIIVLIPFICTKIYFTFGKRIEKRAILISPNGGTFKMIGALSVPVKLGSKQSLASSINIQFQYPLPKNVSEIERPWPVVVKDHKRSITHVENKIKQENYFYKLIETMMISDSINGDECFSKFICQFAERVDLHNSLYDQIFSLLFAPIKERYSSSLATNDQFLNAYRAGRYGVDCSTLFRSCQLPF